MHAKSWWHKWAQLISCQSSENAGGHLAFCDPKQHSKRHIRGLKKTPTCLLQPHAQQILNRPPSWGIAKALGSFSSDTAGKVPSCLAGLVDSAASKSRSWDANHDLGARRSRLVSILLASWSVSKWAQDSNRQSWSLKNRIGVLDWSRYLWALVTNWAASRLQGTPNDSQMTPVVLGAHKNNGLKLFPRLTAPRCISETDFQTQAGILCPSSTRSTKELRFDWRHLPGFPRPGCPWHQATTHGDAGFGLELTPNLALRRFEGMTKGDRAYLPGGFNQESKNIKSIWIISPSRGGNTKCLKPPPSYDLEVERSYLSTTGLVTSFLSNTMGWLLKVSVFSKEVQHFLSGILVIPISAMVNPSRNWSFLLGSKHFPVNFVVS